MTRTFRRAWWWARTGLSWGLLFAGASVAIAGALVAPDEWEDGL